MQILAAFAPADAIARIIPNFITRIVAVEPGSALHINLLLHAKAKFAVAVLHPQSVKTELSRLRYCLETRRHETLEEK